MHMLSAVEIHERFMLGEFSAESIVRHFLQRIERWDGEIKAFLCVYAEKALAKAAELDRKRARGLPLGQLAAIPILLKDNIHVKGEITTCASKFLSNYIAPFDSTVAELITAADGIIIGKSNLDEFAMGSSTENSAFQVSRNPWNLHCSPGGSSGGSAAAVAARLVPLALGSDTGGSIRQPAAFCGITGFKPTYGRVSRYGLVAVGSSFDQIGPLARNTADAALLMEVIGRHCQRDATSMPIGEEKYRTAFASHLSGMKIGVPSRFLEGLGSEQSALFERSLGHLRDLGALIVEVDLAILKHAIAAYSILACAEASTNLARFDAVRCGVRAKEARTLDEVYVLSRGAGFGFEVKRRILLGALVLSAQYQEAYYIKAQKVRACIIQKYKEVFAQCYIVATPTTPTDAFEIGAIKDPVHMYFEDLYTVGANLAGLPAVSIPCGSTFAGKPFGLHLTAQRQADAAVLRVAHAFEQASKYHTAVPNWQGLS